MGPPQRPARGAGPGPPRGGGCHLREPAQRHERRGRAVSEGGQCHHAAGLVERGAVERGHRGLSARGARQGRAARGRRRERGRHEPRGGRPVHAARRRHRLPRAHGGPRADRLGTRPRHGAVRDRRRRQLPRLCRCRCRPRHGPVHRGERQDPAPRCMQRGGVASRPRGGGGRVPASRPAGAGGCGAAR